MTTNPVGARDGAILAARWCVERLRRPAAPGLVWLGFAKPDIQNFACLACGTEGAKQGVLRADGRTLFICGTCASHQFNPPQPRRTTPDVFSVRYQVEYAADVPAAAAAAARAVEGRKRGRLIELGGRLGYVVDIVRHLPGWTAVGVDPGPWPAVGAARLGAAMLHGNLDVVRAQAQDGKFDVVVAENIVDRSTDPLTLLKALPEISATGARWLLAVPDAATIYAATDGEVVRRTASEARVMIPSRIGLQHLLARAGLGDLPVAQHGGMLRADRNATTSLPNQASEAILDRYLGQRTAGPPQDQAAAAGLLVRAIERAVSRSDWQGGTALYEGCLPLIEQASETARAAEDHGTLEALFRNAPVSAGSLLYNTGLVLLNRHGPSTQALLHFELSAALARRAFALAPALMRPESERYWASRFHIGMVLGRIGDEDGARQEFQEIVAGSAAGIWTERARYALQAPPRPTPSPEPAPSPAAAAAVAQADGAARTVGRRKEPASSATDANSVAAPAAKPRPARTGGPQRRAT